MMMNNAKIVQENKNGINSTQIGIQNNYGITPEEASRLALSLFMENFPRLQEEARNVARERVDELIKEVMTKMEPEGNQTLEAFAAPDMQYIFLEAEKGYASFGNQDSLNLLSELIVDRAKAEKFDNRKRIIDKAIEIVSLLSIKDIDYLSFVFLTKQVKFRCVKNLNDLRTLCNKICNIFALNEYDERSVSYLNMIGCLELNLGEPSDVFSKNYGLKKEDVEAMLPKQYSIVPGDYHLTLAAVVIAIINARNKTDFHFDIDSWIPRT